MTDRELTRSQAIMNALRERWEADYDALLVDAANEIEHLFHHHQRALQEKEAAEAELVEFRNICQEFVERVERGEVRSKHTYGRMKTALQPAPGHTDLMISPEGIDEALEQNPLPDELAEPLQGGERYRVGTVSVEAQTKVTLWAVFDNGEAMTTKDAAQRIAAALNGRSTLEGEE